jgi:ubiquinone/menaquinone biosynthesis C-methylase UbiE/DNA-binding transcriptional ArsR family regulator
MEHKTYVEDLLTGLRAIAETTRLRLLFALSHGEFNVSELTRILGQSQPRVSRHLKLMAEAGLLSRYKEGSWVLFRLREDGEGGALARAIVDLLPARDAVLARDLARMEDIRTERAETATIYFKENAANWDKLRSLHVQEEEVEAAMRDLAGGKPLGTFLDLGTGTGRILSLFAPQASQAIGLDSSREMLAIARTGLERQGLRHVQVRHGDLYALPFADGTADFITLHQVLHYLDDPARAIQEAARVLKAEGRLLIVDFAPHDLEELRDEQAHRRLGIADEHMAGWLLRASLTTRAHRLLPPAAQERNGGLTVSIWLAAAAQENIKSKTSHGQNMKAEPV